MLDRNKLAVIHIVKNEIGLADDAYRKILHDVCGVTTSKDLDETGFRKLMRHFARSKYYRDHAAGITFRQKMYIKHLKEQTGWNDSHFQNFVHKYYNTNKIDTLNRKDASKLIESLKNVIRHQEQGHK